MYMCVNRCVSWQPEGKPHHLDELCRRGFMWTLMQVFFFLRSFCLLNRTVTPSTIVTFIIIIDTKDKIFAAFFSAFKAIKKRKKNKSVCGKCGASILQKVSKYTNLCPHMTNKHFDGIVQL